MAAHRQFRIDAKTVQCRPRAANLDSPALNAPHLASRLRLSHNPPLMSSRLALLESRYGLPAAEAGSECERTQGCWLHRRNDHKLAPCALATRISVRITASPVSPPCSLRRGSHSSLSKGWMQKVNQ
jgi:hypothetical protein